MEFPIKNCIFLLIFLFAEGSLAAYSCDPVSVKNNNCQSLVKLNVDAGLGRCFPDGAPDNIESLLAQNNIRAFIGRNPRNRGHAKLLSKFEDYSDPRLVALARVVNAYAKIGGPALEALRSGNQIDVSYSDPDSPARNSRRYGQQIQIAPGNQNSTGTGHTSTCGGQDNHGLIAHELAHYIARANTSKILVGYQRHMGGSRCGLTHYSGENQVEEIAEVIAAYVTMPQMFTGSRGRGAACQKAFAYMKQIFDEPQFNPTCESRKASIDGGRNIQMASAAAASNSEFPQGRQYRTHISNSVTLPFAIPANQRHYYEGPIDRSWQKNSAISFR